MRAACSGLTSEAWVQRSSEDSSSICIDLLRVRFAGMGSPSQFDGFGFRAPQVELAGAERGDGVNRVYVFAFGNPEFRQSGFRETLPDLSGRGFGVRVENRQTLAALVIED